MKSKTVVVTGAHRGIGREVARLFLSLEYAVFATCTQKQHVNALASELGSEADSKLVTTLPLDVRSGASVRTFALEIARRTECVDVLVNNAGVIGPERRVEDERLEDWDNIIATNIRGPFLVSQALIPLLKKSGEATIINVSGGLGSFSSGMEGGSHPAYRISKTGLNALTLILHNELQGIRHFSVGRRPRMGKDRSWWA